MWIKNLCYFIPIPAMTSRYHGYWIITVENVVYKLWTVKTHPDKYLEDIEQELDPASTEHRTARHRHVEPCY